MVSTVSRFTAQSQHGFSNISHEQIDTQAKEVLRLIREAHARGQGVNRAYFIFELRYTQVGARIAELNKELEHEGLVIRSRKVHGQRYVEYFLAELPHKQHALSDSPDWYERTTGSTRPPATTSSELPLFDTSTAP
jgi:hypothetical protein